MVAQAIAKTFCKTGNGGAREGDVKGGAGKKALLF